MNTGALQLLLLPKDRARRRAPRDLTQLELDAYLRRMSEWRWRAPGARGAAMTASARASTADEERPTIEITTERHEVVAEALEAVRADSCVFQRDGRLVHVVRTEPLRPGEKPPLLRRPVDAPQIVALPAAVLSLRLAAAARWKKFDGRSGSLVGAHPPDWAVRGLHELGTWPGIRHLEAVVETPVLRPDGTVLDSPGYDASTGLLYRPSGTFLPVPSSPTREQAQAALRELEHVVVDFPFEDPEAHRAAWLAALLSPIARHAFEGPSPLFPVEANTRGSGKSKLVDVITNVIAGRDVARTPHTPDENEFKKLVTTVALEGDPIVLIDNIRDELNSRALEAVLTGTVWRDRILGASASATVTLKAIWFGSGNNFTLRGDLVRRSLPIRLLSPEPKPEERKDFAHPNLLGWVRENRAPLLRAALTVLRSYCAAGRPDMGLPRWGSFEGWSDLVRNALRWAGAADPWRARERLVEEDPEVAMLTRLLDGLDALGSNGGMGYTIGEMLTIAEKDERLASIPPELEPKYSVLWEALEDLCPRRGGAFNKKALGERFRRFTSRVIPDGRSLGGALDPHSKVRRWYVLRGARGVAGGAPQPPRQISF